MTLSFSTKSETLAALEHRLRTAVVLPQVVTTVAEWRDDPEAVLTVVTDRPGWLNGRLIVRSSAQAEDAWTGSLAGHFRSRADVSGPEALRDAIAWVAEPMTDPADQVFVQPMLTDVAISGVAFGRDPNSGGTYRVVNYDPRGESTSSVTSGATNDVETFVCHKSRAFSVGGDLGLVMALLDELEKLFETDALDVEFALDAKGVLHLLQVRPLAMAPSLGPIPDARHIEAITDIARKLEAINRPHPYLLGRRTLFGVMPDWNPAEVIGIRPRPLALSLYRDLVTDSIWAYQRDNYGYRNLRSFPLLVDFHGLPYIDVRVSFNSFIPKTLDEALAARLVDYYLDRLAATPVLHDKVEFEIVFSCYTLDLPQRLAVLADHGFTVEERTTLADRLRDLTNRVIDTRGGLWLGDLTRIHHLEVRRKRMLGADLDLVSRIYWLLEDCKRHGTLPFAGLARAGFIAVQLLNSLRATGILEPAEVDAFMRSLDTIGSRLTRDFRALDRDAFLERYGHLRPGTYDILSPRYGEAPERYFDWEAAKDADGHQAQEAPFALTLRQLRGIEDLLRAHRIDQTTLGFLEFIKRSIEAREYAKFVFTHSLSDALELLSQLGALHGLSTEDLSFCEIGVIRELYTTSHDPAAAMKRGIETGRGRHALTRHLTLPPLLESASEVWAFHVPSQAPNFITQSRITAAVASIDAAPASFSGAIVMIPSADPGYDWIFSRGIGGFVTMYGGVNSHMAIRAGELGIPAVIGAGEKSFLRWAKARLLDLDCANRAVRVVR